jgi:hypothetical protein
MIKKCGRAAPVWYVLSWFGSQWMQYGFVNHVGGCGFGIRGSGSLDNLEQRLLKIQIKKNQSSGLFWGWGVGWFFLTCLPGKENI